MHLSDFTPEELRQNVVTLASEGATDWQIAGCLGVHPNTFWKWKTANRDGIADALREGRMAAVGRVENALFKRATGYTAEDGRQVTVKRTNRKGEVFEETRTTVFHREVPPHLPSIQLFLRRMGVRPDVLPEPEEFTLTEPEVPPVEDIGKYYGMEEMTEEEFEAYLDERCGGAGGGESGAPDPASPVREKAAVSSPFSPLEDETGSPPPPR